MKIITHSQPQSTLEDFADKHGLVMEVRERQVPLTSSARFYASFANSEVKEGSCFLAGVVGDGITAEAAITDYAKQISFRVLVIDAMKKSRREIQVPRIL